MKKLLNTSLLLTSLLGYMEWGGDNCSFIFQVEYELFSSIKDKGMSLLHPFIVIPLVGQVILFITIVQKQPNRALSIIGLVCLSVIMLFLHFVGVISSNMNVVLSTIPFLITGILFIWFYNKKRVVG